MWRIFFSVGIDGDGIVIHFLKHVGSCLRQLFGWYCVKGYAVKRLEFDMEIVKSISFSWKSLGVAGNLKSRENSNEKLIIFWPNFCLLEDSREPGKFKTFLTKI
jgi:hypothetical protein